MPPLLTARAAVQLLMAGADGAAGALFSHTASPVPTDVPPHPPTPTVPSRVPFTLPTPAPLPPSLVSFSFSFSAS